MIRYFDNLSEIDLKLALLKGATINVENIVIKPYTTSEIEEFGYERYSSALHMVSLSKDDFLESIDENGNGSNLSNDERIELKAFDFYVAFGGQDMRDSLITGLSVILRNDDIAIFGDSFIVVDFRKLGIIKLNDNGQEYMDRDKLIELGFIKIDDNGGEYIDDSDFIIINRDNFDDIITVAKLQNYLEKPKSKMQNDNPVDEETRMLQEHMKRMRAKVEKVKKQQSEDEGDVGIDISDIISAVASKSNSINKLNVWDLTLYQLYDEYARLEIIDNYDFSIRAMMAGAKDVKLEHWSKKIAK